MGKHGFVWLSCEWFHESVGEHFSCWDMCDIKCSILNMFVHEMEVGANMSALTMEAGFPCDGDGSSVV